MHVLLVPNYIKILSAYLGFLRADGCDEVNSSSAVDCCCEHFKKCSVTSSEFGPYGSALSTHWPSVPCIYLKQKI